MQGQPIKAGAAKVY